MALKLAAKQYLGFLLVPVAAPLIALPVLQPVVEQLFVGLRQQLIRQEFNNFSPVSKR